MALNYQELEHNKKIEMNSDESYDDDDDDDDDDNEGDDYKYDDDDDDNGKNEHELAEISDKEDVSVKDKNTKMTSDKKKRKHKKAGMRRNIRNVFSEGKLAEQTKKMREQEQERLKRLGLEPITKQAISTHTKQRNLANNAFVKLPMKAAMSDIIFLDSDSDEQMSNIEPPRKKLMAKQSPVVILSSDSEDNGDSDADDSKPQSDNYYSELGLHTNDLLNQRDEHGRVIVNVNHSHHDEDLFLHPAIANILKPHQIGGVRFLYDNLIESLHNFRVDHGNGCILAHAMGLGKTIQTITFVDLFLRLTPSKKVLCVVPVNTIQNWMNEFNQWLPPLPNSKDHPLKKIPKVDAKTLTKRNADDKLIKLLLEDMVDFVEFKIGGLNIENDQSYGNENELEATPSKERDSSNELLAQNEKMINYRTFQVFMADSLKTQMGRAKIIEKWDKVGGVLLMGYEMYRSIAMYARQKRTNRRKKCLIDEDGEILPRLKNAICDPGPDLVVCDEGHRIRNYQSGISQALKSIRTRKRLVLTGYPLQNNLIEYWCMVDFVRPNYLGSRQEFANMFERPIMNGQCVDSTNRDKHLMKQRAHVLYSLLEGFVQRRGHGVFQSILPEKEEHVIMIRLSPIQKELYKRLAELTKEAYAESLNPIKTFCLCCKIWNHPDILYKAILASNEGKQMDIISDEDDIALDEGGHPRPRRKKKTTATTLPSGSSPLLASTDPLFLQHNIITSVGFDPFGTEAKEILTDIQKWAGPIFQGFPYALNDVGNSGKFHILKQLIDECLVHNDKMLVFSQSLLTLNCMEEMLQKTKVNCVSPEIYWRKGVDYYRLDGSTGSLEREKLINSFNDSNNHQTKLFLLSTRAGCLGINLVAANRVIVFDVSWNPCHDAQAVCRIYRYGQTKRCYIYRFVSSNTMEKKMYYRQISKKGISDRVVDELNLTENFSKNDIQSLVDEDWVDEPVLSINDFTSLKTTDTAMTSVLRNSNQWVTKVPFKHESLLIEEGSHKLTGSEKRAAKRAYEQEKMHAHSSQVSYRTYPLQPNFPRNSPVAPVRPFLWRPPAQSSFLPPSWSNMQSPFTMADNMISSNNSTADSVLHLLRNAQNSSQIRFQSTPLNLNCSSSNGEFVGPHMSSLNSNDTYDMSAGSGLVNNIVNNARNQLSTPFVSLSHSGDSLQLSQQMISTAGPSNMTITMNQSELNRDYTNYGLTNPNHCRNIDEANLIMPNLFCDADHNPFLNCFSPPLTHSRLGDFSEKEESDSVNHHRAINVREQNIYVAGNVANNILTSSGDVIVLDDEDE